jgi:hypothetical protein
MEEKRQNTREERRDNSLFRRKARVKQRGRQEPNKETKRSSGAMHSILPVLVIILIPVKYCTLHLMIFSSISGLYPSCLLNIIILIATIVLFHIC